MVKNKICCIFAMMKEKNNLEYGVLFDLDGVLLDTEDIYTQFWEEIDHRYPTGIIDFARVIKGSNLHEILHKSFHDVTTRLQVTELLEEFQRGMRYNFFDGALEFVQTLYEQGIPAVIVTSSDDRKMNAVYAQHPHFKALFSAIITGDMVSKAKPDPECFLLGAKKIGRNIENCFVFEDSINGLRAAQASGATVIGLSTTNTAEQIAPYSDAVIGGFRGFTVAQMLSTQCID